MSTYERSRHERYECSASRHEREKYPPDHCGQSPGKPKIYCQQQLVPRCLELTCSNEKLKDFSKAARIYSEASNIDSQSNEVQIAYLIPLMSSDFKLQFKIYNEKNRVEESKLTFNDGIEILKRIYKERHNIINQRLAVMRMSFKGDRLEDLLNYYYEYSNSVDTSSTVTMNREEYLALNMLMQVGSTRQEKILEKTTKPQMCDILDYINSEITVNNISNRLKKKDNKDKVLRVEGGEIVCFKCNRSVHYRSKCEETDEKKFHCSSCTSYGHVGYKCKTL